MTILFLQWTDFRSWQAHSIIFQLHTTHINMPIPLLAEGFGRGLANIPYLWTVAQAAVAIGFVVLLKYYFGGARCRSERVMHGKVVMVTVCSSHG